MNVQGIEHGAAHASAAANVSNAAGRVRKAAPEDTGETTTPKNGGDTEKTPGVIRLLQEGHFKGVADVRLRINFFDELSAIDHGNMAQALTANVPAILASVNEPLEELMASGTLSEEQSATFAEALAAFNDAVNQAAEGFADGESTTASAFTSTIQSAFDTLAEALQPVLTALAPAEGEGTAEEVDEAGAVEDGAENTGTGTESSALSALETFLDDLRASFDGALAESQDAFTAANPLPELSEPSGNGVAYEKFLAIYNALRTGADGSTASQDFTTVDTVV